jgi:hypothetical protein
MKKNHVSKCINIFILALIFAVIGGCSGTKLAIEKPTENYLQPNIQPPLSTLALSLDLNIQDLENSINNYLKSVIYEDNNIEDDNLMLKVWKQQNIHFSVTGNKINCSIPLKIWVQTGFKKNVLGVTLQQYYQANGSINIDLSTTYQLQKNWQITTSTNITHFNWIEEPKIKVAGLNLPVTTIANITLNALRDKINKSIDDAISKNLDVKQIMTKTWEMAQKPIQVNNEYDVWLKVTPKNILSTPMLASNNHVYFNLGMNAFIETSVGKSINNNIQPVLPDYQYVSSIKPNFSLHMNVNVDFKKLTDIASKQIVGRTFNQGGKHITIDKVDFYGHDGMLVVATHVSGSANGDVYCVGKFNFDNETQTLHITDFDFDVKTKNALVKTANWLMHNRFLKMIEPYLTISLKDQMKDIINSTNHILGNYQIMKGINLNGKLDKVTFDNILIAPSSIVVGGNIEGMLKLNVNQIQF